MAPHLWYRVMAVAMELDQTLQHMSREMCEAIFFFLIFDQVGRTESAKAQGRVQSKYKFWQCQGLHTGSSPGLVPHGFPEYKGSSWGVVCGDAMQLGGPAGVSCSSSRGFRIQWGPNVLCGVLVGVVVGLPRQMDV